ncbi:MAG: hypothetical protein MJZ34_07990 [Paludibacteraceae bacterium]|nr:hypothetical protein [Paludibacteraceae bacterium]
MKYVQIEKFWRVWDKDPELMLVNKAGRVVKVDTIYNREYYEQEIRNQLKLYRYLAKHSESVKWLQVNSPEEIPDDLFKIVPYDEQKCIADGIIEIKTEEEYNKCFYPRGKVEK